MRNYELGRRQLGAVNVKSEASLGAAEKEGVFRRGVLERYQCGAAIVRRSLWQK